MEAPPAESAPALQHLSICVSTAAASPLTVAALTRLTFLQLQPLYDEDNTLPLESAALDALLGALGTLPRLAKLDWAATFPLAGGAGGGNAPQAQPGDAAGAAGAAGTADVGGAAGAPAADWAAGTGSFPALKELSLEFPYPSDIWGHTLAGKDLILRLGLPAWVARMQRLERLSVLYAGEAEAALRAALPPGADFKAR